ncbi:MAG: hypothetical protein Tp1111DCM843611_17 [Prokaryotic dsDNA virus sp.]|nr:MAG: hypothetical protein Tp1111DCM843611_17 [Prokaryotic dsDNA virus sp.]|tara:strand:+ start:13796 stop:16552 length:2757 start_codon:yes stop_codon:yes gene_type:complete
MSVQLVVFPQNHQGYQYTAGSGFLQLVTDGVQFASAVNSTNTTLTTGQAAIDALTTSPPTTNWQRFTTSGGTAPTVIAGQVRFTGNSSFIKESGIYQRINGLVVGQQYQLVINVTVPATTGLGTLIMGASGYSNNLGGLGNSGLTPITDISVAGNTNPVIFTAQSQSEVLVLQYVALNTQVLDITSVSITTLTPTANSEPRDGQVIVDLYEEEEIPLTLSVDDFKNVAEKVQSYSKDFNLPATKRNNKIFDNIFDITRKDTGISFNPYKQTQAILKENGFTIFQGYLRLIEIKTQKGEISYNVNLYSEAIALADILQNKTFSDIDLSELSHNYNYNIIEDSWTDTTGIQLLNTLPTNSFAFDSSLAADRTNVLKYPFCDWTGKINYQATASQVNANANSGMPSLNQLSDAYRPWIQIRYLLNKIFKDAGFTWTSTFFDTADFGKLFMDFNWGNDFSPADYTVTGVAIYQTFNGQTAGATFSDIIFDIVNNTTWQTESGYDSSTGKFTSPSDNTEYFINSRLALVTTSGGTLETRYIDSNSNTYALTTYNIPASGNHTINVPSIIETFNNGETINLQWKWTGGGTAKICSDLFFSGNPDMSILFAKVTIDTIVGGTLMNTLRGELNQFEFLKGIMTMFNLITLQDPKNPTNILIEPYDDIFLNNADSKILDWTNKVDNDQLELKPLELTKTTVFKFTEDEDYPYKVYKAATQQHQYGSLTFTQSDYTLLTGEEEIEVVPFAATVVKPIFPDYPTFIAPAIYGANDDGTEFEPIENAPRILYNCFSTPYEISSGAPNLTYFIPAESGVGVQNENSYKVFSHTSEVPSLFSNDDYVFGTQQLIGLGDSPVNTLFARFYQGYYGELYHPDTRTLTVKMLLTGADLTEFRFFDKIQIKNKLFRVNKINYKPGDLASVELILIP